MTGLQLLMTGIFSLCLFSAGVAGVELSGFYPAAARPPALRRTGGRLLIALLVVTAVSLAATALWVGLEHLPWTAVIIAGGLALLFAPLGFEMVPRRFWDSRVGATAMVLVTGGLLALVQVFL